MGTQKKYPTKEKLNLVQEPTVAYNEEINLHQQVSDDDWNSLPDFVKEAIEVGINESNKGLGTSHSEFMKVVKEKYPFINGI